MANGLAHQKNIIRTVSYFLKDFTNTTKERANINGIILMVGYD